MNKIQPNIYLLCGLSLVVGILFGGIFVTSIPLSSKGSVYGLLDLSLVIVALIGPFLAVEYASKLVSRDVRTELICAQQYKVIEDIDRTIRRLISQFRGKTSINIKGEDLLAIQALSSELDEICGSLWISKDKIAYILEWQTRFNECLIDLKKENGKNSDHYKKLSKLVSELESNRQPYLHQFLNSSNDHPFRDNDNE